MRLPDLEQIRCDAEYFVKDAGDTLGEAITHKGFRGRLSRLDRSGLKDRKTECIEDAAMAGVIATGGFTIYSAGKGMELVAKRMIGRWGAVMNIGSKVLKVTGMAGLALGTGMMTELYRKSDLIESEASSRYLKEEK